MVCIRFVIIFIQGLNYVTAVMLLVMRDETKAFWLLNAVTNKLLPGKYWTKTSTKQPVLRKNFVVAGSLTDKHYSYPFPEIE